MLRRVTMNVAARGGDGVVCDWGVWTTAGVARSDHASARLQHRHLRGRPVHPTINGSRAKRDAVRGHPPRPTEHRARCFSRRRSGIRRAGPRQRPEGGRGYHDCRWLERGRMAWRSRDGSLYVAEINRILRYDRIESRLNDPPEPVVVTDAFPTDWMHGWKFIAFGPDDKLYVPVGAPCNVCDRGDEEPRYSSITRMNRRRQRSGGVRERDSQLRRVRLASGGRRSCGLRATGVTGWATRRPPTS